MPNRANAWSLRSTLRGSRAALLGAQLPPGSARRNWRMIMIIQWVWAGFLGTSIMSTYYTKEMGLSNVQVYTLQTTWAVVATLGTTVGGWLADRYGIRKVMLWGTGVNFVQVIYFATCQSFWQFEIALVGTGAQAALLGGTCDTLCTATLRRTIPETERREELFQQYQRVASRLRSVSIIFATLCGNYMATHINMHLPFIVQGFVTAVPIIAVWRVVELREPAPHLTLNTIRKQLRLLLMDRPDIRWAVASYVITGASTIAGFWLIQPRMLDAGISPRNFGWIYACQSLCMVFFTWGTKALQRASPVVMWGFIAIAAGIGALVGGLNTGHSGLVALLVGFSLFRACAAACLAIYLYKRLGEDDITRSIDISIVDAIQTLAFGAVGLGVGFVADTASPETAYLVIGGGCLILNSVVLFRLWRATRAF
ncbi:MAG TPA: MFS transporter [Candidatus Saccharimonadales bacterium]|nr:MFS transporter [Candidatus Saccharimonadales bacterium]